MNANDSFEKMTVGERLRYLRKCPEVNLPLEKFGERIGFKKSSISTIETGRQELSSPMFRAICREFNVREAWLLHGTGDMFAKSEEISLDDFARQHGATDFEIKIIKAYFSLGDDLRHEFLAQLRANIERESSVEDAEGEYIKKISSSAQNTESTASSSTDATA